MKLDNRKFSIEGFGEQSSWIGKLFTPLNAFIAQVYSGFQNNLTVSDNLYQEIKTVKFVNETSSFPIKFATKFNKYPELVVLGHCTDSTGAFTTVYPLMKWTFADGVISISSISNLTTSANYTLKLLVIYG